MNKGQFTSRADIHGDALIRAQCERLLKAMCPALNIGNRRSVNTYIQYNLRRRHRITIIFENEFAQTKYYLYMHIQFCTALFFTVSVTRVF